MAKEKIALVVDSTCGYTKKEIEKMGGYYVPLNISINNDEYLDGVTLTEKQLIDKMTNDSIVKTSSPSAGLFEEEFKKALKTHDKVFCVTLSKKLSSSIESAKIAKSLHKEWNDKIFILDSLYGSSFIQYDIKKMFEMINSGTTIEALEKLSSVQAEKAFGAFAPKTLIHLKNGGRISDSAAIIGNVLKILPVLTWVDGHMDPDLVVKTRTFKRASLKCINIVEKKWKTIEDKENYEICIISTHKIESEFYENFIKKVKDKLKLKREPIFGTMSGALVAHVGPDFIGVLLIYK